MNEIVYAAGYILAAFLILKYVHVRRCDGPWKGQR